MAAAPDPEVPVGGSWPAASGLRQITRPLPAIRDTVPYGRNRTGHGEALTPPLVQEDPQAASVRSLGVSRLGVRKRRLILRTLAQQIELLLGVEFAGLRGTQEVPQDLDEADGLLHVGGVTHPLHHLQPAVG